MVVVLKVRRFRKDVSLPGYEKRKYRPACFDFEVGESATIEPKKIGLVKLNVAIKVPEGYALMLYPRSSTPLRKGLIAPHSVGIGDAFYCGDNDEYIYEFLNITDKPVTIERGESLVQGMLIKVEEVIIREVDKMEDEGVGGYKAED